MVMSSGGFSSLFSNFTLMSYMPDVSVMGWTVGGLPPSPSGSSTLATTDAPPAAGAKVKDTVVKTSFSFPPPDASSPHAAAAKQNVATADRDTNRDRN